MRLKLQTCAAFAIVAVMLAAPAIANADAVTDWNAIAVQATVTGARPGATGVLDIAMVQAAVYDAVQAIENGSNLITWRSREPPAHRWRPPPKPRTMCSSTAFRRRPRPSTRPTNSTCSTMAC